MGSSVSKGAAAGWSYEAMPTSEDSCGSWDAIHSVFEAIAMAREAASSYLYALSSAAAWIAGEAYDKVKRAAASVKRFVLALIERLYGSTAAASAETKLGSVDGLIGARDASSLVESTVAGISGGPSPAIVPARSSWPVLVYVQESHDEMMSLLESIPSVEKKVGLEIPAVAKATIAVITVAAGLGLAVCSPTMLAAASIAAAAFI